MSSTRSSFPPRVGRIPIGAPLPHGSRGSLFLTKAPRPRTPLAKSGRAVARWFLRDHEAGAGAPPAPGVTNRKLRYGTPAPALRLADEAASGTDTLAEFRSVFEDGVFVVARARVRTPFSLRASSGWRSSGRGVFRRPHGASAASSALAWRVRRSASPWCVLRRSSASVRSRRARSRSPARRATVPLAISISSRRGCSASTLR